MPRRRSGWLPTIVVSPASTSAVFTQCRAGLAFFFERFDGFGWALPRPVPRTRRGCRKSILDGGVVRVHASGVVGNDRTVFHDFLQRAVRCGASSIGGARHHTVEADFDFTRCDTVFHALCQSVSLMRREESVTSGVCSPTPEQKLPRPPPSLWISTTGVPKDVFCPNRSAILWVRKTVEDPTIWI